MPKLPDLDPVIHGKVRLAIMSLLAGADEADFTIKRLKVCACERIERAMTHWMRTFR